jgi:hypothetical protein
MAIIRFLLILLFIMFPIYAFASEAGYICKVTTELDLHDDGSLKTPPNPLTIGAQFAVDRKTGVMINPEKFFWNIEVANVSVKSLGNNSNCFIATYISKTFRGVFFTTLNVKEYADTEKKPFLLTAGTVVYAGVCE